MNDLNEMPRMCHDCPYWEVCEPPYICAKTEAKFRERDDEHMTIKKKNAMFGRYPSCDMLNNAIRFLREEKIDSAMSEIIFAIEPVVMATVVF